jgi:hypothetical protein
MDNSDVHLIYVLLDGVGDLPHPDLDGKTPLEAANTPTLDKIASNGTIGEVISVGKGIAPESDIAVFNMLGYSFEHADYAGRGVIEAIGVGVDFKDGDLALRGNYSTLNEEEVITDRRAGSNGYKGEACNKKISFIEKYGNIINCLGDVSVLKGNKTIFLGNGTTTLTWDWGDGNTSTSANEPQYTYTSAGTYDVSMTIEYVDDVVAKSWSMDDVVMSLFTDGQMVIVNQTLEGDAENYPFRRYLWSEENLELTGTSNGYKGEACNKKISFIEKYGNATNCLGDVSVLKGNKTIFLGNGTTTLTWDWGDGNTSTSANEPQYTYTSAGTYDVSMTIEYVVVAVQVVS